MAEVAQPGLLTRMARALVSGFGPSAAEYLRSRSHFHAPLPDLPLAAVRYAVFDLESTGLNPSRGDRIVAIGAVLLRDLAPAARFRSLVDPGRPIPAAATRHHGITDAMVRGAPRAAEALAAFRDFAGPDSVLVAHNAAFDRTLLHMAELDGAPGIANPIVCSMAVSRWLDPQEEDHSLDGICARQDIVIPGRHEALADALATAEIWRRLLARAAALGVEHLPELARRTGMERAMAAAAAHF